MFRAAASAFVLFALAALAQDPILSPTQKTNLRTARLGLPSPLDTNQYRVTAVSRDEFVIRTQILAITTVTIVTAHSNQPPVLVWRNGVYAPYIPASRPKVISVVTQHHSVFHAPEIKP